MQDYELSNYAIVADIGGTFARFGRVHLEHLVMDKIEVFPCAEFASLEAVLVAYQTRHSLTEIKRVAIAIACPVLGDVVNMTNCHWHFSISAFKQKLNLTELTLLNDFTAIALSLPILTADNLHKIGEGTSDINKPRVVLGAGTGLGVAYLVPGQEGYIASAGEGGHARWGATTEQEWFIYNYLKKKFGHVSHERVLSGQGLEHLYAAITEFHKVVTKPLTAPEIIAAALARKSSMAQAVVAQFFSSLGAYAGDLALTFGALGGVYIAGGIAPRLLPLIDASDFRLCFEAKGRFHAFNAVIPTYVITAEQPGMLGAAVSLQRSLMREIDVVF